MIHRVLNIHLKADGVLKEEMKIYNIGEENSFNHKFIKTIFKNAKEKFTLAALCLKKKKKAKNA